MLTADDLADLFGDGSILAMPLHQPPLYYKSPTTPSALRIWTPSAERRAELRSIVYPRDGFTCQGCGDVFEHPWPYDGVRNVEGLTLGHLIPYRMGGPYLPCNLRAECVPCNGGSAFMCAPGTPSRDRSTGRGDGWWASREVLA
jgi:hypothetical protein